MGKSLADVRLSLMASDDGLNAAGGNDQSGFNRPGVDNFKTNVDCFIKISGEEVYIDASGDGVDSNGDLTISGGQVTISGPTNSGNGTLDYAGNAMITGGTVMGAGSSGMAQGFSSSSSQGSILYSLTSTYQAGTRVLLQDSDGNEIVSHSPAKTFSSVNISTPEIVSGGTYILNVGNEEYTIEMSGIVYSNGGGGNPMMGGGGHGGRKDR